MHILKGSADIDDTDDTLDDESEGSVNGGGSRPKPDAFDYALNLLSRQMQATGQLRTKLSSKKYKKDDIEDALEKLTALRFLDDQSYAETYFENLKKYKSHGFYGIQKKLYERQLPKKVVEKLMGAFTVDDELEIAARFLGRQYGDRADEKPRLSRMLQNRGFRTETIVRALKRVVPKISAAD